MGEGSRVPSSGRSPDDRDRSADAAPAVPPTPGESSLPEVAQGDEGQMSASTPLPRRVRGTNGARPPVQVERPALPESFLERFRAAAAASEAREAATEREVPVGRGPVEDRRTEVAQASPGKTSKAASALPVRARGKNGAPKPPARRRLAFPLEESAPGSAAGEAITQPIPVVPDPSVAESPGGESGSTAAARPGQQNTARPHGASATEPAGEAAAAAVTGAPVRPAGQVPPMRAAEQPADLQSAAPRPPPDQRRIGHPPSRMAPKPTTGKKRTGHHYRMVGLLVLLAALAAGAGSFVVLQHKQRSGHSSLASADIPLAIRNGAGAWVAGQVATSDVVACDPVMCRVLQTHGMAAGRLRVLWPGSDDLSGCAVIVATPVLRGRFGGRLDSWYAPGLIARFGSGAGRSTSGWLSRMGWRPTAPTSPVT